MTKPRSMKEYIDGYRSFMDFAVRNCRTPNQLIVCPCKMCRLNRRHPLGIVLDHLIGERGMWPQYKEWIYHGERPVYAPLETQILIYRPQMQVQAQIKVAICKLCYMIFLACMVSEKTTVSLNPRCRVMKNTLLMMRPILGSTAEKSTRTCLKRQRNHFMIRHIVNLAPL
jgi:hypothetical protein